MLRTIAIAIIAATGLFVYLARDEFQPQGYPIATVEAPVPPEVTSTPIAVCGSWIVRAGRQYCADDIVWVFVDWQPLSGTPAPCEIWQNRGGPNGVGVYCAAELPPPYESPVPTPAAGYP